MIFQSKVDSQVFYKLWEVTSQKYNSSKKHEQTAEVHHSLLFFFLNSRYPSFGREYMASREKSK